MDETSARPVPGVRFAGMQDLTPRAAAAVLMGMLLDAGVETVLGGSPVRWTAAGLAAAGAGLSVVAWRRYSARAAAWTALFLLLLLLAVTAWMSAGTTAGVVMARQPTSRVLAAVAALGVVLASLTLARVPRVPLPGKAAAGLLALYALWALAWGIVLRTPYPDLLHGASTWERLPFWLQGAFIGAIIIVPAGLLAQLLSARASLRAGKAGAWAKQSTALALVTAMAFAGIAGPGGGAAGAGLRSWAGAGAGAGAAGARPGVPAIDSSVEKYPGVPGPISLPARPRSYEEAVARVDRLVALVRGLSALVDPASLDIAARAARIGPGLDASFYFVRDEVRFEPYAGVMRGARGALVSLAANDLDRTLLLSALLRTRSHRTRVARGTLDPARVGALLRRAVEGRPASGSGLAARVAEAARQAGERELLQAGDAVKARGDQVKLWVDARAAADASALDRVLGSGWFRDEAARSIAEGLRTHFWLQVERDGEWVDLDPSFADAQPGRRFAEASAVFDPAAIPANLLHTVRVSMTAEYLSGDRRSTEKVLDATLPAPDLVTEQMRLSNEPSDLQRAADLGRARRFKPTLRVGQRKIAGREYELDAAGRAGEKPDLSVALFGGEQPPGRSLARLWIEIVSSGPGATPAPNRRYLVDRTRGGKPGAKGEAALKEVRPDSLPYLLLSVHDILVMPAPYPEELAHWLTCRSALENEAMFRAALDVRFRRASRSVLDKAVSGSKASVFSPPLTSLAASVSRHAENVEGGSALAFMSPFVAMFRQGFEPASVAGDTGAAPALEQGFDIVNPGAVPVGGSARDRAGRGLRFGAFLTNLELALSLETRAGGAGAVDNASAAGERALRAKAALTVVRSEADVAALAPASADAWLADLKSGRLVVAPRSADGKAGAAGAAWWRVDAATGVPLGVNARGQGQAMTEEQLLNTIVTFASAAWCELKVARQDLNEFGQFVGFSVCVAGWAVGMIGVFATVPAAIVVGLAAGFFGDICGTN